ncbi:MAG: peptide deformylase [Isosphaeraceae bacterium]|nr:peptide deformylase [Isosphaeraceae bacterium]
MLRIVPFPHPALRYEARPVTRIDERLRSAVREMFDLMYEARGIGLAATQVAIPLRFFILNLTADPNRPEEEKVFINPEILKLHSSDEAEEGCLSFPGLYAKVTRPKRVRVRAYDLDAAEFEVNADELFGRAILHEHDHLEGKLFVDYLGAKPPKEVAEKIKEIEAGFRKAQTEGAYPPDDEIRRTLDEWETLSTAP